MGMIVYVYRNPLGDCTNNGASSRVGRFCVTNIEGPFEPTDDAPAARLIRGPYDSLRLVPQALIDAKAWVMFGGNLAMTSDSRFSAAVKAMGGADAVKIFDRVEK